MINNVAFSLLLSILFGVRPSGVCQYFHYVINKYGINVAMLSGILYSVTLLVPAKTKEEVLAALTDHEPVIFSPVPRLTLQNVALSLPVQNSSPEQSNSQPPTSNTASRPNGIPVQIPSSSGQSAGGRIRQASRGRDIPATEIIRNQESLVQMPVPKVIPPSGIIRNREPLVLTRQEVDMPNSGSTRKNKPSLPKPRRAGKPSRRGRLISVDHSSNSRLTPDNFNTNNIQRQQSSNQPTVSFLELEEQHNRRCPFKIQFSSLPDIFMSRSDFDQLYLLPALRTHFLGGRCRTEGMKMYLDWLSYLRERLFTV